MPVPVREPAPVAVAGPMPRPAYPMRQANPLEMAYQQMLGGLPAREPTQTFFDIGSTALVRPDPALIQRSQDVASSIDAIKKKIGIFTQLSKASGQFKQLKVLICDKLFSTFSNTMALKFKFHPPIAARQWRTFLTWLERLTTNSLSGSTRVWTKP